LDEKNFIKRLEQLCKNTKKNLILKTPSNADPYWYPDYKNILTDPRERFYFTKDEEEHCEGCVFICERFKGEETMSFNTFPNTYLNYKAEKGHLLFVYNEIYKTNKYYDHIKDNIIEEVLIIIKNIIPSYITKDLNLLDELVYSGVDIDGSIYSFVDVDDSRRIRERLKCSSGILKCGIPFILDNKKNYQNKIFRTLISRERSWKTREDKIILYIENKVQLPNSIAVETLPVLLDANKKKYFTDIEQSYEEGNEWVFEIFKERVSMSFNVFPNTYLNMTSPYYHHLHIYNYTGNSESYIIKREIKYIINILIQSDESDKNKDLAETIVYTAVNINNVIIKHYDDISEEIIENLIEKNYSKNRLNINFIPDVTKNNHTKIFRSYWNAERVWKTLEDKKEFFEIIKFKTYKEKKFIDIKRWEKHIKNKFFTEKEESDCLSNKFYYKIFNKKVNMSFNFFPNTVLDLRNDFSHQLHIYKCSNENNVSNVIKEIEILISFLISSEFSENDLDFNKTVVYNCVNINKSIFSVYNEKTAQNIKKLVAEHYNNKNLEIFFILPKKKHGEDRIFRALINSNRNWYTYDDKKLLYLNNNLNFDNLEDNCEKMSLNEVAEEFCLNDEKLRNCKKNYFSIEVFNSTRKFKFKHFPTLLLDASSLLRHKLFVYDRFNLFTNEQNIKFLIDAVNLVLQLETRYNGSKYFLPYKSVVINKETYYFTDKSSLVNIEKKIQLHYHEKNLDIDLLVNTDISLDIESSLNIIESVININNSCVIACVLIGVFYTILDTL
jgi:hypothetical protein